eukprot:767169-Hanusia_phi.AAC.2
MEIPIQVATRGGGGKRKETTRREKGKGGRSGAKQGGEVDNGERTAGGARPAGVSACGPTFGLLPP